MVSILGSSPNHGRAFAEGENYPLVPPVTPWAQAGPSGVSCGEISQTGDSGSLWGTGSIPD